MAHFDSSLKMLKMLKKSYTKSFLGFGREPSQFHFLAFFGVSHKSISYKKECVFLTFGISGALV